MQYYPVALDGRGEHLISKITKAKDQVSRFVEEFQSLYLKTQKGQKQFAYYDKNVKKSKPFITE
jgi:hypothetical protein